MEEIVQNQLRRFVSEEHIKNVLEGAWVDMFDDSGQRLAGIRGRVGVTARGVDGHPIGLDLMEIMPGSGFPRHFHMGDHILLVLSGEGVAQVDGKDYRLRPGDSIFVAAEQPHAFLCPAGLADPWQIIGIGHPHRHLSAIDRMKRV